MNIFDILIFIIIAAAVFFAVRRMRKNKGTCGCADCPHKKGCQRS